MGGPGKGSNKCTEVRVGTVCRSVGFYDDLNFSVVSDVSVSVVKLFSTIHVCLVFLVSRSSLQTPYFFTHRHMHTHILTV